MGKAATADDLQKDTVALLREVEMNGARIAITRNGKAVAFLVPIEDAAFLDAVEDRADLKIAMEVQKRIDSGEEKTYSIESVAAELGIELSKK